MSLNDLFKAFFGFKDPFKGRNPGENIPDFHDEDNDENLEGFDDIFKHFHQSMLQQMEELNRQMEDMFHNSGSIDFPGFDNPHQKPGDANPRDSMLKEPDSFEKSPSHQMPRIEPPGGPEFFHPPSFFGRFSPPRMQVPELKDRQDKDIGDEAKIDDIVDLFKKPKSPRAPVRDGMPSAIPGRSGVFSSSRSFSTQTIKRGDGKIEQRTTVRDGDGNEETTITRSLGDQTHSVTIKTDKSGVKEQIDNFNNMDQDDLSKFNEKWDTKHRAITDVPRDSMLNPPPPPHNFDDKDKSIFRKFFGL